MTRSRNLTPSAVEHIVSILDGWSGKLTWDLLIISIARHLKGTYTRQALHKHERIKRACMLRKQILETSVGRRKSSAPNCKWQTTALHVWKVRMGACKWRMIDYSNNLCGGPITLTARA